MIQPRLRTRRLAEGAQIQIAGHGRGGRIGDGRGLGDGLPDLGLFHARAVLARTPER